VPDRFGLGLVFKPYGHHPRFFDEQLGSAVGAIDYVRGSGNRLFSSIPL
jgi:hypothetical protein